jgi:hypothetical protein
VVIASGSGPLDRDSNHRRAGFDVGRQLALALTEAGFATYRYDKRGVGESPGDWREGAILAAMVAAGGVPASGVVLLSMSATPGEELLLWQARQIAPTLPAPVRGLLRLLRTDLVTGIAANHARIRATTTDVARIDGAKLDARWTREFMAHDPRTDLARIEVPVLADLVPGAVQVHRAPDLTHTLRTQPGRPSLGAYKGELREPVNRTLLANVSQ